MDIVAKNVAGEISVQPQTFVMHAAILYNFAQIGKV